MSSKRPLVAAEGPGSHLIQQLIDEELKIRNAETKQEMASEAQSEAEDRFYQAKNDIESAKKEFQSGNKAIAKAEKAIVGVYKQLSRVKLVTVTSFDQVKALSGYVNWSGFKGITVKFDPSLSESEKSTLRSKANEVGVDIVG